MYIVLRVLKKGSLAAFLTPDSGKIIAYYRSSRPLSALMPGSIVLGDLVTDGALKYPFMKDVRLFSSASPKGLRAPLFFSAMVDVVYMFLPQGQDSGDVFILMHMVVESRLFECLDECLLLGPCFLVVLFDVLGFYASSRVASFSKMMQDFLNDYMVERYYLANELAQSTLLPALILQYDLVKDVLKDWVFECLSEHPQFKKNEKVWMDLVHTFGE